MGGLGRRQWELRHGGGGRQSDLGAVVRRDVGSAPSPRFCLLNPQCGDITPHRPSVETCADLNASSHLPLAEIKEATGRSTPTLSAPAPPPPVPSPAPASDVGPPISRSGLLTIRLVEAKNLALPQGVVLPSGIQKALEAGEQAGTGSGKNRDSLVRKQMWWLPCVEAERERLKEGS